MADDYRTERVHRATPLTEFGTEREPQRRHLPPHAYQAPPASPRPSDVTDVLGLPAHLATPELLAALQPLLAEFERLRWQADAWQRRETWMERQADRHSVVPCLNRRAFVRELDGFLMGGDCHGTVALMQVAGIEALRQLHGLAAGEGALRHVAAHMLGSLRTSDLVACIGGSDFAVLLPGTAIEPATAKMNEACRRIQEPPFTWLGQPIPLRPAFGVRALSRSEGAEQVLAAADRNRRGLDHSMPSAAL